MGRLECHDSLRLAGKRPFRFGPDRKVPKDEQCHLDRLRDPDCALLALPGDDEGCQQGPVSFLPPLPEASEPGESRYRRVSSRQEPDDLRGYPD